MLSGFMNAGKPLNVGRFQNNGGFGISSSYFRKGCAVTRISTRSRSSRSSRRTSVQVQGSLSGILVCVIESMFFTILGAVKSLLRRCMCAREECA